MVINIPKSNMIFFNWLLKSHIYYEREISTTEGLTASQMDDIGYKFIILYCVNNGLLRHDWSDASLICDGYIVSF